MRGALKIYSYGETLGEQAAGDKLFLNPQTRGKNVALTLTTLRPQGKFWIVQFRECSSMEDAQALLGEEVFVPEDRLPPAEEGEYYHFQLLGLEVETLDGKSVGILTAIMETAGNDVYVVDNQGREVLVPAVEEIVCSVDLELGKMVIDPPEGLLDDL